LTIEQEIQTALFERVASLVLSPVLEVSWPNVNFDPPENESYIVVKQFPNGNTRYSQTGSDPQLYIGILQITVITPLNKGPSDATQIAGEVAEHFNTGLIMRSGVAKVVVTKAPEVATAITTDSSYDVPISVEYECNA
jgi:hypothetical protein